MKNFLFMSLCILIISSCATTRTNLNSERKIFYSFVDYNKYYKEGFFVSPYPYTGIFEPVGILKISIIPEVIVKEKSKIKTDGVYDTPSPSFDVNREAISISELMKIAVDKSKEMGANALVDFNISIKDGEYELTGFAIKIKQ